MLMHSGLHFEEGTYVLNVHIEVYSWRWKYTMGLWDNFVWLAYYITSSPMNGGTLAKTISIINVIRGVILTKIIVLPYQLLFVHHNNFFPFRLCIFF